MTTPTTVNVRLQLRADTAANWTAANPTLLANEVGLETDTKKLKVGNGSAAWNSLAYFPSIVSGGTVLGNLEIGSTGTLTFEGSTADGFETTLAVTNPTADRTITLPNVSGTVVTTGDTGSVTSTMIADGTIVNGDINASAAIAGTKISPDFGSQTITTTGVVSAAAGAAATPSITFTGDLNTGIYSPGADQVAISTNGTGRLFIDSSGRLGLGTSSPASALDVSGGSIKLRNASSGTNFGYEVDVNHANGVSQKMLTARYMIAGASGSYTDIAGINAEIVNADSNQYGLSFRTGGSLTSRLWIAPSGNVGIGTTSPSQLLHVNSSSNDSRIYLGNSSGLNHSFIGALVGDLYVSSEVAGAVIFRQNATERARIDSSGRLLVGTSSQLTSVGSIKQEVAGGSLAISTFLGNAFAYSLPFTKSRGSSVGTIVQSGDELGNIDWYGDDGSATAKQAARIQAFVDGTPGANDMPGRLVFSTTADGASSPTERMTIYSNGNPTITNSSFFRPGNDNAVALGQSGLRWTAVWAANGTIQTSDGREKTAISDASLGSDFIKALRPVSYKWIEGGKRDTGERDEDNNYIYESVPGERTHWGFIAQEVKQAVDDAGVDFGGWVLTDKDDPDSQQALRYDQFIAPLTKALQEAIAKIETLEAKVAALESA